MVGDWEQRWRELLLAVERVEEVYRGRRGGSVPAQHDVQSFFERSSALVDWVAKASGQHVRAAIRGLPEPWLAIACDLAVSIKHAHRTREHLAGDPDLAVVSQSAAVYVQPVLVHVTVGGAPARRSPLDPPATGAHSWTIRYTPPRGDVQALDALDLARRVVGQWRALLPTFGLVPPV